MPDLGYGDASNDKKGELVMNEDMHSAMSEATRLTVAGRLTEATALIQRRLDNSRKSDLSLPGPQLVENLRQANTRPSTTYPLAEPTIRPRREQEAGDIAAPGLLRRVAAAGLRSSALERCLTSTSPTPPDLESAAAEVGGLFVTASYTNVYGTRGYKLYVPSGYTGHAVPLIIMLHGGTQSAVDFAAGTRMNEFAERNTFLVAYPEQPASANAARCWNWFQAANQDRAAGEPSLIAGITRKIMSDFEVDARRVYVAGFSAGGAMAMIMASTYADLYAAVGVHSGLAYGAAHDLPSAFAAMKQGKPHRALATSDVIPLIVFHGDGDHVVDRVNADCILDDWSRAASNNQHKPASQKREPRVERGQVVSGREYTRFSFHDGVGKPSMELWIVHDAGHAWSGGSSAGSYTDPQGPDASAQLVRFFAEHPKEKPVGA
ncbi:MAG: PHB depolymerase family esterase [Nitriliruptorales bacterium]